MDCIGSDGCWSKLPSYENASNDEYVVIGFIMKECDYYTDDCFYASMCFSSRDDMDMWRLL